jgi:hypothetical protein
VGVGVGVATTTGVGVVSLHASGINKRKSTNGEAILRIREALPSE